MPGGVKKDIKRKTLKMEITISIKDAVIRLYRGGSRTLWKFTDDTVEAAFFNAQVSKWSGDENGGTRVCYEYTVNNEEEANRIVSYGEESLWDLTGKVTTTKVLDTTDRNGKPEKRVFIKLRDVEITPKSQKTDKKVRRYVIVKSDENPSPKTSKPKSNETDPFLEDF